MKTWHKVGIAVAILLAVASWVIALTYWSKLPDVIPTHFGFDGQADDWQNKSVYWAFMLPMIQTLMAVGLSFLYYKPQYSDMPTTLWLMTMDKKVQEHAFALIRTMLVGTMLWIGVLFTYIVYGMNEAALTTGYGLNNIILISIVVGMLAWLVWWTVKVYKATRAVMKGINSPK